MAEVVLGDQRVLAHVVLAGVAQDEGAHLAGVVDLDLDDEVDNRDVIKG